MSVRACVIACVLCVAAIASARTVQQLRIIVPSATVRTGPGFLFRALYEAQRDEVLEVVARNGAYWFQVKLPDGRHGWVYGEQTLPFTVEITESHSRARWRRFTEAVFSPSPLETAHVSLTFSGGALGGDGMFMFRPAVIIDRYFGVEGHIGTAVGSEGTLLPYGVDGVIYFWPEGFLTPFVALGPGGATSFPKVNGVTQKSITEFSLDAGGGLLIFFKKRITLRADVRNYTLMDANRKSNVQEYSGGLAIFF